jgi:hypothetical protein
MMMTELSQRDFEALELAMTKARQDARRAAQLDGMLAERPWLEVAQFAAYCCQTDALRLKPWERPPCHGDYPSRPGNPLNLASARAAASLLKRMRAAGISKYHPDPLAALAEADARKINAEPQ